MVLVINKSGQYKLSLRVDYFAVWVERGERWADIFNMSVADIDILLFLLTFIYQGPPRDNKIFH